MVLDAKAMAWAAQNNIDTAKLKAAKIPIYGKWYFPELPNGVPLVNLQTGERRVFDQRVLAGEVIWVTEADLARAGLLPAAATEAPPAAPPVPTRARVREAPEPLLAIARPPGIDVPKTTALVAADAYAVPAVEDSGDLAGVHLPRASIAPFVLAVGFCIAFLGIITHPVILFVGLVWMLIGSIAWIRIGLLEDVATHAEEPDNA
jgi:hypothetical protein